MKNPLIIICLLFTFFLALPAAGGDDYLVSMFLKRRSSCVRVLMPSLW
jgi:hypothetical protein